MNNNICECKIEDLKQLNTPKQTILADILQELNKLKLENECLKADKSELQKEVEQLKTDNEVLHNMINSKVNDGSLLNEIENGDVEIDYESWAKEYDNYSLPTI